MHSLHFLTKIIMFVKKIMLILSHQLEDVNFNMLDPLKKKKNFNILD